MRCSMCLRRPVTTDGCTGCDPCLLMVGMDLSNRYRTMPPPVTPDMIDAFHKLQAFKKAQRGK